ncbi:hypothetical protein CALVIDRAFT_581286 [Calocera viscosa TUFC12733]|uniref:Uncharacterized protein n=1 Tax=Calocera viscosa (strain TUFC12733) TaxID=1330018 RepID=A0A167K0I4_CALVF|nr:hypothetical protein CALVIDRAFT_581286 [Calocera viscosa TUFC12733]
MAVVFGHLVDYERDLTTWKGSWKGESNKGLALENCLSPGVGGPGATDCESPIHTNTPWHNIPASLSSGGLIDIVVVHNWNSSNGYTMPFQPHFAAGPILPIDKNVQDYLLAVPNEPILLQSKEQPGDPFFGGRVFMAFSLILTKEMDVSSVLCWRKTGDSQHYSQHSRAAKKESVSVWRHSGAIPEPGEKTGRR